MEVPSQQESKAVPHAPTVAVASVAAKEKDARWTTPIPATTMLQEQHAFSGAKRKCDRDDGDAGADKEVTILSRDAIATEKAATARELVARALATVSARAALGIVDSTDKGPLQSTSPRVASASAASFAATETSRFQRSPIASTSAASLAATATQPSLQRNAFLFSPRNTTLQTPTNSFSFSARDMAPQTTTNALLVAPQTQTGASVTRTHSALANAATAMRTPPRLFAALRDTHAQEQQCYSHQHQINDQPRITTETSNGSVPSVPNIVGSSREVVYPRPLYAGTMMQGSTGPYDTVTSGVVPPQPLYSNFNTMSFPQPVDSQEALQNRSWPISSFGIDMRAQRPEWPQPPGTSLLSQWLTAGNAPVVATTQSNSNIRPVGTTMTTVVVMTEKKSLPASLACSNDLSVMSEHQAFLRLHIEAFCATHDDVNTKVRGRNQPITIGQVGIRCRHCAHVPTAQRQKCTVYLPSSTCGLYQAAQNLSAMHIQCGQCTEMPNVIKQRFVDLIPTKTLHSRVGRNYWAQCAIEMFGLVDTEHGIFLAIQH